MKGINAACTGCSHKKEITQHPYFGTRNRRAWRSVGEPCMTAPETRDKTKAAGDVTQPWHKSHGFKSCLPFYWLVS